MKILLITDQHFGVRNDNQSFIDHYRKFYGEVVLPFIDSHNVSKILCLGDTFDKRRSINFMSLEAAKEMWFTPLQERGIVMDMLVGNHDIYYKNTLRVNAPSELLGEYSNINVIREPTTAVYDGLPILLLPWICDENRTEVLEKLRTTEAKVCMGHLELNGFEAHPGHVMQNGMDAKHFSKFEKVFSGHYHMKSTKKNVTYLGNPYQLYWNDYGCKRGFHVFDTDTMKTTFHRNPFDVFHKLYYNGGVVLPDENELQGAFVKLIVEDKGDYSKFDYVVSQLQDMGLGDLKIIEDLGVEVNDSKVVETEDTMTLLDNYIDGIDLKVNKSNIKNVMRSLYMEAAEI
jgi:DNA repair exonuclease SbcCD nuclease subunit